MLTNLAKYAAFVTLVFTVPSCSNDERVIVQAVEGQDCTFTQGYWKNHEEAWPVSSLSLGSTSYTKAQLLAIFGKSVNGNGLVALAHQLIAAKLNVAFGADDSEIADTIAAADALIGSLVVPPIGNGYLHPSKTSALNDELTGFNQSNGATCAPEPVCGDGTVDSGEVCDDGNTANGDGCSATCMPEPPPPACGDGSLDDGEACDDGNTANGDGCSSTCTVEPPPPGPVCGNGVLEGAEECDDGNTTNGDGCSSTCVCEPEPPPPGPVCGNGVIEGDEQCDDGNTHDGDGCSASCLCEPAVTHTTTRIDGADTTFAH